MVEYYGNNDYRDYLMHYGVKGMKWGKHLKKKFYEVKNYLGDKVNDARSEIEYQAENVGDKITGRKSKKMANSWREHAGRDFKNGNELGGKAAAEQSRLWQEEHRNSLRLGTKVDALKRKTTDEYKLAKENNRQNNLRGAGKTFLQKDRMGEPERSGATKAYIDYFKGHGYGRIKEIPGTNGSLKVKLNKKGQAQANSQANAINAHENLKFEKEYNRMRKKFEESRNRVEAEQREFQEERKKRKKRG